MNNKNRLIRYHEVSVGSLTASTVHPREVFKAVILAGSAAFICVHNHPSGDPTPSLEDREITLRLKECADFFGLRLLDHVIVGGGNDRYYSFSDRGTPPFPSLEFHAQSAEKNRRPPQTEEVKNHTKIGLDRK
jgi:DNA repair protein RadC